MFDGYLVATSKYQFQFSVALVTQAVRGHEKAGFDIDDKRLMMARSALA
ncbi:MAG: hypothetical protein WBD41_06040 [Rhodococcus sp. (in: high G+C Gram-positive bacteria)]